MIETPHAPEIEALKARVARLERLIVGIEDTARRHFAERPIARITGAVARHYGLRTADILSDRRARPFITARFAIAWVAWAAHSLSTVRIARALGDRDHTTIMNAIRRAEELRSGDSEFRELTERLLRDEQKALEDANG